MDGLSPCGVRRRVGMMRDMEPFIEFPIGHPFHGEIVRRFGEIESLPLLFEYRGTTVATNLFRMHDEVGFSLADSISQCVSMGWVPALDQFVDDAFMAGWPMDRARRLVHDACNDANYTQQVNNES